MINIFKKETAVKLVSVQQIHNEFNNASNELLNKANEILNQETTKEIESGKKLQELCFTNTPQAVLANTIKNNNEEYKKNMKLILYYNKLIPEYKFINHNQIIAICKKYNLIFGKSDEYKGYIPEKNINDIENYFNNKNIPSYYYYYYNSHASSPYGCSAEEYKNNNENDKSLRNYHKSKSPLFIVAPEKDFNLKNKKIINNQIVPLDPIVLAKVFGGYIIVTAWGLEAEDKQLKK